MSRLNSTLGILIVSLILCMSVSSAALGDGLVSYYTLDETSGTTAYDSLLLYNLTNEGATINQVGKINKAYSFDGTNDFLFTTTPQLNNRQTRSIGLWIYPTQAKDATLYRTFTTTDAFNFGYLANNSIKMEIRNKDSPSWITFVTSNTTINQNQWNYINFVYDNLTRTGTIYLNGVNVGVGTHGVFNTGESSSENTLYFKDNFGTLFKGYGDEVGVWNKTLTPTEILQLYNSGSGLTYPFGAGVKVTLESPLNATTISDIGANFTVSGNNLSSVAGQWDNITYYVWNNGTLFNQTTIDFTNAPTFNQTLFIDNFSFSAYQWNAKACYINVTGKYCVNATNNNTLYVSLFTILNETYVNDTISGTLENFSITLNLLPGYELLDASFIYNGTDTSPTIYSTGVNRYLLVSSYPIPISLIDINVSFNWDLTFTGGIMLSTDNKTQLIRAALLDNCSVYTNYLFNLSLLDENTQIPISGDIEVIYTLLNKPIYATINKFSFKVTNKNNTKVCSSINLSFEDLAYSAEIRYLGTNYASELYNIQRADIGSSIQNILLYDLNESKSTQFKVTYQDDTFNFVEGAVVQLQRRYISEDAYKTVEAPLTSSDGFVVLHIDLDSIKYRAVVVKNGVVLDTFENIVFKCQSELTGECEQKLLGNINPQNNIDYDTTRDFTYSVTPGDNNITVSYTIPSSTPSSVNIVLVHKDQFANETICNKTVLSSGGSIECTYTDSLGISYLELTMKKDGLPIAKNTYVIEEDGGLDFLDNNYIFVVVLMLSLVGMALTSPEWIVINAILTLLFSGMVWLVNGISFVTGLGILMWLIFAAGIIILKLSKQEDK